MGHGHGIGWELHHVDTGAWQDSNQTCEPWYKLIDPKLTASKDLPKQFLFCNFCLDRGRGNDIFWFVSGCWWRTFSFSPWSCRDPWKKLHQLSSLETSSSQYYFFLKSQNRFFLNSQSISQVRCCTSESTNELDQLYIQCKDHLTIYCKPLLVKPGVLYVCREKFTNLMNYSDALGVWWCFQCWRSKGEILTLQSDSGAAWQKIASRGRSQLAGLCQMLRPACWLTEVLEVTLTVVIMPWPDSILPQNFCSLCYAFCFDAVPRPWTLNLDESLTKFQSIIS